MQNLKQFVAYYSEWLKGFDNDSLVKYEENLSDFIDCDLYDGFLLADEVNILYELIRDECVRRVSRMVACKV